jgi:preprotein translocase subunit YajC
MDNIADMDDLMETSIAYDVPPAATSQQPSLLDMAPMFIAFLAIFYFLVIRPQQKEQSSQQKLIASLQKGDKVVLRTGLYGVVYEVQQTVLLITIAENVRVEVEKSAVRGKVDIQDKN